MREKEKGEDRKRERVKEIEIVKGGKEIERENEKVMERQTERIKDSLSMDKLKLTGRSLG